MNERAVIGGNNPPEPIDPMDAIQSQFDDTFAEVANWLDGSPVETEAQMQAVDALIVSVKEAEKAAKEAKEAKEAEYRPHKAAGDAVIARWKVFLDDLDRQRKGLLSAVEAFKQKRRAEQEAAARAARAEAEAKMRAAEEAARAANAADLEAQREAARIKAEADDAVRAAAEAKRDTTKGLRKHTEYVVIDATAYARWLWMNDREALTEWMSEHARKNKHEIPDAVVARVSERAF